MKESPSTRLLGGSLVSVGEWGTAQLRKEHAQSVSCRKREDGVCEEEAQVAAGDARRGA